MALLDFLSSGNERLDKQLLFTAQIDKMTAVLRHTVLIDKSRRENDAEHSWHIAVMCLLFAEYAVERVDCARSAAMCVVHDLIEIYAGDTFAYDKKANEDKKEREKIAADKLFSILPDEQEKEIRALWEEFDEMQTAEAKYANCMDKLQPFLHNTLTDGFTWSESNVKKSDIENRDKIIADFMPEVYKWIESNISRGIERGWIKNE